jgi:hypothetical protein
VKIQFGNRLSKTLLFLSMLIFISFLGCDEDVEYSITFSGTVRYIDSDEVLPGAAVELRLYKELQSGGIVDIGNKVKSYTTTTDENGNYVFTISSRDLPLNPRYGVSVVEEDVINVGGLIGPCYWQSFGAYPIAFREKTVDLLVDSPTYLQLTFDKVDHGSTDNIRYGYCLLHHMTSNEIPDITVTEKYPFSQVKTSSSRYYTLIKSNGEEIEKTIEGIEWVKSDTTKITIQY